MHKPCGQSRASQSAYCGYAAGRKMGDGGGPISSMLADKIVDRFEKKNSRFFF